MLNRVIRANIARFSLDVLGGRSFIIYHSHLSSSTQGKSATWLDGDGYCKTQYFRVTLISQCGRNLERYIHISYIIERTLLSKHFLSCPVEIRYKPSRQFQSYRIPSQPPQIYQVKYVLYSVIGSTFFLTVQCTLPVQPDTISTPAAQSLSNQVPIYSLVKINKAGNVPWPRTQISVCPHGESNPVPSSLRSDTLPLSPHVIIM